MRPATAVWWQPLDTGRAHQPQPCAAAQLIPDGRPPPPAQSTHSRLPPEEARLPHCIPKPKAGVIAGWNIQTGGAPEGRGGQPHGLAGQVWPQVPVPGARAGKGLHCHAQAGRGRASHGAGRRVLQRLARLSGSSGRLRQEQGRRARRQERALSGQPGAGLGPARPCQQGVPFLSGGLCTRQLQLPTRRYVEDGGHGRPCWGQTCFSTWAGAGLSEQHRSCPG